MVKIFINADNTGVLGVWSPDPLPEGLEIEVTEVWFPESCDFQDYENDPQAKFLRIEPYYLASPKRLELITEDNQELADKLEELL